MPLNVFLDLDGTLTDPKPGITGGAIYALTQLGLHAPHADDLEWIIGPPLLESFAKLGAPDPQAALDLYRVEYQANGLFDATVYAGIPQALDDLKAAGYAQFLATAKPHAYAKKITANFGLDRHMTRQYGPELDGTRNDKGELLAYALAELGLHPNDCVMVGDRSNDLRAARATDMPFVGVAWGYGTGGELDGADVICETPSQLSQAIAILGA